MASEKSEIKTYFGRCRCCLTYGYLKYMWSEHYWEGETEIYGIMLTQCFALSVEQDENDNSDHICDFCIERLRDAYNFKKQVLDSHQEIMVMSGIEGIKNENLSDEEYLMFHNGDNDGVRHDMSADNDADEHINNGDNNVVFKDEVESEEVEYEDVEFLDEDYQIDLLNSTVMAAVPVDNKPEPKPVKKTKWPKKLPKKDRLKTYKQYTEDDLKKCIEAVSSERMSIAEASDMYKVPRKTLTFKVRQLKTDPDLVANMSEDKQYKFIQEIKTILTYTNATPYRSKAIRYYCFYCPCGTDGPYFDDADDLRTHTRTQHADDRIKKINFVLRPYWMNEILKLDIDNLVCNICCYGIENWNEMFRHLSSAHKVELDQAYTRIVPYALTSDLHCTLCNESFSNYILLDGHMNAHYNNYVCDDCGDTFVAANRLKQHMKIHAVGKYPCDECGKVFSLPKYRKKHVEMVHKKELKFKCLYCPEKFQGEYLRHLHVVEKHNEKVKIMTCEYCGKTFDWRQYYMAHLRKAHIKDKKHACKVCDKRFVTRYEMREHEFRHGDKNFLCIVCDKKFRSKTSLRVHSKKHLKAAPAALDSN